MFFPTLFNSDVGWSPKMVTTFYTHWMVFREHLSNKSLLATLWILFYEALKRIMFITTFFINSVVCRSPKMVTTFYTHWKVFRQHLSNNWLLATSWILFYEALKRIMFFTTSFINSVVCWSPKMITTFYTHYKVFRKHLSNSSLLATSWILFYEALKRTMFVNTLFINSVVCWLPKRAIIFSSRRKFFCWHLSDNSLVATSWMCSTKLWSV